MSANGVLKASERVIWPVTVSAMLLLVWFYAVKWTGTKVFPSPLEVERGLAELMRKGLLWHYIADSLRRVAIGFGTAAALGIPLGLTLGWYPSANRVVNPVLQFLRPISPIAWIPVAIILFGVGDWAATFLIFLGSFFPIVVTSTNGVASVPIMFKQAGRNFGLTSVGELARVVLPAALPEILVGLRIAFGVAWLVVVAAEMIAVNSGLGYLVIDARNSGKRYDLVVAAMFLIGVIGLIFDTGFRRLERIDSVRWRFRDSL